MFFLCPDYHFWNRNFRFRKSISPTSIPHSSHRCSHCSGNWFVICRSSAGNLFEKTASCVVVVVLRNGNGHLPTIPDRSGHFASGELATIFWNTGNSWNLSETEIGVQRPSLHWQTLMHSESLQLFRSHGETRGAVKTYQKSVPIILIFVAIVFDSPFSCQNIFLY